MVCNKSHFIFLGSPPKASGLTKLSMFNDGAINAEVHAADMMPGFKTVHVIRPCNKLNGLLTVFILCDI